MGNSVAETRRALQDVFREMDGFVALVSVLSVVHVASPNPAAVQDNEEGEFTVQEPEEQLQKEMLDGIRLALVILADAMYGHPDNARYFQVCSEAILLYENSD
jgi:hypothetical protein